MSNSAARDSDSSSDSDSDVDVGEYPWQPPRIDAVLYQAKVPPFKAANAKKRGPAYYQSRGDIKRWDPAKLPSDAVDGYLHFARQVFGDESAFYSEAALDILHDAGYDIPRAQRRLLAPMFEDISTTDLDVESAIETRRLELLELVTQRRQADAADACAFSERVRERLNSAVPLSFVELQHSIMQSALRAWDSLPIAVELRLLQGRASRWSNRLRPILTAICAPAARVSVVSAALAQASSATAQPKDTAVSAPVSTGTGSCSLEDGSPFSFTWLQQLQSQARADSSLVVVPELLRLDTIISNVRLWVDRVTPQLAVKASLTPSAVHALLAEAARLFPHILTAEVARLRDALVFARDLTEVVTRRLNAYAKKTRLASTETKMTLSEAKKVQLQLEGTFAFLDVSEEADDLEAAITDCEEVAARAQRAMNEEDASAAAGLLDELRSLQLVLPEIDLITSFHQGLAWSADCDRMLASRPKLQAIRAALSEADKLALTAPPHQAKRARLSDLADRAAAWQERAKHALLAGTASASALSVGFGAAAVAAAAAGQSSSTARVRARAAARAVAASGAKDDDADDEEPTSRRRGQQSSGTGGIRASQMTCAAVQSLLDEWDQLGIAATEEPRLRQMLRTTAERAAECESRMLACRPPESGGKKAAVQSKPFTVAEMRALAERLVGADLCFVEGEFASDLFQWLESAEAWVDAANLALSREFPRVNPIRALLAEAADDENFNRFIVLPHLDELRSAVARVERLIEDARIMIEQPQPLKELSTAYSLLYRYGVGESEPVFSTLRQRHLEGVAWQESARKHVPPLPIATEASAPQVIGNAEAMLLSLPPPPPPSQQRRLPGLEKIASLVDQKSDPESSLAMVIFEELDALEMALTTGRSWQTRARAALDRLDEMEEKDNAQKVEGSADSMSLSTISAEKDALLVELACLLLEGRALPLRISEKEELETRIWALAWVARARSALQVCMPLDQLCALFQELHAYRLDATTVRETIEIGALENRIAEAIQWTQLVRAACIPFVHPLRAYNWFGPADSELEFEPLTTKPGMELALAEQAAQMEVDEQGSDEGDEDEADADNDDEVRRSRRARRTAAPAQSPPASAPTGRGRGAPAGRAAANKRSKPAAPVEADKSKRRPAARPKGKDEQAADPESDSDDLILAASVSNFTIESLGDDASLYCICRQPHTDGVLMMGCESCDAWFHPHCLGLSQTEATKVDAFVCLRCCVRDRIAYPYRDRYPPRRNAAVTPASIATTIEAAKLVVAGDQAGAAALMATVTGPPVEHIMQLLYAAPVLVATPEHRGLYCMLQEAIEAIHDAGMILNESMQRADAAAANIANSMEQGSQQPAHVAETTQIFNTETDSLFVHALLSAPPLLGHAFAVPQVIYGVLEDSQELPPPQQEAPQPDAIIEPQQPVVEVPAAEAINQPTEVIVEAEITADAPAPVESLSTDADSEVVKVEETSPFSPQGTTSSEVCNSADDGQSMMEVVARSETEADQSATEKSSTELSEPAGEFQAVEGTDQVVSDVEVQQVDGPAAVETIVAPQPIAPAAVTPAPVVEAAPAKKPRPRRPRAAASADGQSVSINPAHLHTALAQLPPALFTTAAADALGGVLDALELAHMSLASVPLSDLGDRILCEERLREVQARLRIHRMLTRPASVRELRSMLNEVRATSVAVAGAEYVSVDDVVMEDAAMAESAAAATSPKPHKAAPQQDKSVIGLLESFVTDAERWVATVKASLDRRTSLTDLQRLATSGDRAFARVTCADRKVLEERLKAGKQLNAKIRVAVKRQARHTILYRLLLERQQNCPLFTSPDIEEVEKEVQRAEAWRERLYAAVDQKATREVFSELSQELHHPGRPVAADVKDMEILDDCMRMFCLCQIPWQNDVFMIGCDDCDDWFHPECVGLSQNSAKRVKNFICPRCHDLRHNAHIVKTTEPIQAASEPVSHSEPTSEPVELSVMAEVESEPVCAPSTEPVVVSSEATSEQQIDTETVADSAAPPIVLPSVPSSSPASPSIESAQASPSAGSPAASSPSRRRQSNGGVVPYPYGPCVPDRRNVQSTGLKSASSASQFQTIAIAQALLENDLFGVANAAAGGPTVAAVWTEELEVDADDASKDVKRKGGSKPRKRKADEANPSNDTAANQPPKAPKAAKKATSVRAAQLMAVVPPTKPVVQPPTQTVQPSVQPPIPQPNEVPQNTTVDVEMNHVGEQADQEIAASCDVVQSSENPAVIEVMAELDESVDMDEVPPEVQPQPHAQAAPAPAPAPAPAFSAPAAAINNRINQRQQKQSHRVRVDPELAAAAGLGQASQGNRTKTDHRVKAVNSAQLASMRAGKFDANSSTVSEDWTSNLQALMQQHHGDAASQMNPLMMLNIVGLTDAAQNFTSKLFDAVVGFMPHYESKVALFHFLSTYKNRPLNDGLREELWAGISRLVPDEATLQHVLSVGQVVFSTCVEDAVKQLMPTLQAAFQVDSPTNAAANSVQLPTGQTTMSLSDRLLMAHAARPVPPVPRAPTTFLHLFASDLTSNSEWVTICFNELEAARAAGTLEVYPAGQPLSIAKLTDELAYLAAMTMNASPPPEEDEELPQSAEPQANPIAETVDCGADGAVSEPVSHPSDSNSNEVVAESAPMTEDELNLDAPPLSSTSASALLERLLPLVQLPPVGDEAMPAASTTEESSQGGAELGDESNAMASVHEHISKMNLSRSIDGAVAVAAGRTALPNHLIVDQWNMLPPLRQRYYVRLARHDQLRFERENTEHESYMQHQQLLSTLAGGFSSQALSQVAPRKRKQSVPKAPASDEASKAKKPRATKVSPPVAAEVSPVVASLQIPFVESTMTASQLANVTCIRVRRANSGKPPVVDAKAPAKRRRPAASKSAPVVAPAVDVTASASASEVAAEVVQSADPNESLDDAAEPPMVDTQL